MPTTAYLNLTSLKKGEHDYPTQNIHELEASDIALVVSFVVVFVVGFSGNLLVGYVFLYRNHNRLTTMELLIVFLAVADLIASVVNPVMFVYWTVTFHKAWDFGDFGCKILPSLTRITVTVSLSIILIITMDRCFVICFTFRRNMKRYEVYLAVFGAVIFSIVSELCYTIYIEVNPLTTCQVPDSSIPGFVYPFLVFRIVRDTAFLLIFSVTVVLIYKTLYDKEHVDMIKEQRVVKHTEKIMVMLIAMAAIFVILVYPRDILHVVFNISWLSPPGIPYTKAVLDINSFLKVLHMCNSICNVFIYARLHGKFRRRVLRLVKHVFTGDKYSNTIIEDRTVTEGRTVMSLSFIKHTLSVEPLALKYHPQRMEGNNGSSQWPTENKFKFSIQRLNRERQLRGYRKVAPRVIQRLLVSKETVL